MRNKSIFSVCIFFVVVIGWASGEDCTRLQHASATKLVAYLDGIVPNDRNAACIAVAIKRLTPMRFEPAIPVLVRLLDFRRPPTEEEKIHFFRRPQIPEELYPATGALEEIGQKALPVILDVIRSSTSAKAREHAVRVWMQNYRDESEKGVELLQQEAARSEDPVTRENLKGALSDAAALCAPKDKAGCEAAAVIRKP